MAVYVDDMNRRYKRMIMCHMIADTSEELYEMAERIELPVRYLQNAGTYREHFDVALKMKAKAIEWGAKEITQRELVEKIRDRIGKYGTIVAR